ncbi:MAG: hypothetical protein IJK05_07780 [Bacteroidales bacterium]|nr:hypothetical protein [Bacteroidales bacterium]
MKRFLLITLSALLALSFSARAQEGLQIDSLFNGGFVPKSRITESIVTGRELKPYNLDFFRSVRLQASDGEIRRIVSWLEGDALMAVEKEMDSEKGELVYALLRFASNNGKNRYLGYQVKESSEGSKYVTVVYMTGKATSRDLKVIFKHR